MHVWVGGVGSSRGEEGVLRRLTDERVPPPVSILRVAGRRPGLMLQYTTAAQARHARSNCQHHNIRQPSSLHACQKRSVNIKGILLSSKFSFMTTSTQGATAVRALARDGPPPGRMPSVAEAPVPQPGPFAGGASRTLWVGQVSVPHFQIFSASALGFFPNV